MAWSSVFIPLWMRWLGVALGVMAGVLLTWTLQTLGSNLMDTVVTRREHTLVTSGPYIIGFDIRSNPRSPWPLSPTRSLQQIGFSLSLAVWFSRFS
jgi:hypothetical protein